MPEVDSAAPHSAPRADRLQRPVSAELDAILGQTFPVLNDGFLRVVDYMGTDDSIVQAARVSYGKGTKKVQEDRGLIRYLLRHRHTTPFEMCEIKVHVRVPMDAWRQWVRHRTANINEYSTRYSEAIDSAQATDPGQWRLQSEGNRQGSDGFLDRAEGEKFTREEAELQDRIRSVYAGRLGAGIAREQARKELPLSTYTEAYWKVDLHNLLHFLSLRMDSHAQLEIRAYAEVLGHEIVRRWLPTTWQAFLDFRTESTHLTRLEGAIVRCLARGSRSDAEAEAQSFGWLKPGKHGWKRNRERIECEEKLKDLGFEVPWPEAPEA